MSLPISLTSEHLITSLILWRVQMGVPDGTSADWRTAPIGWLWLSGRWSGVIILSLGGDMLTSYLAHCSSPLFSTFSLLPVSTSSPPSASCSRLLPSSSSSATFRSDEHKPRLFCKLLISFKRQCPARYCMIRAKTGVRQSQMSTRVIYMYMSS